MILQNPTILYYYLPMGSDLDLSNRNNRIEWNL